MNTALLSSVVEYSHLFRLLKVLVLYRRCKGSFLPFTHVITSHTATVGNNLTGYSSLVFMQADIKIHCVTFDSALYL